MKLEEKINSDLKQALKDKKEGVVSTLRMLKAAIESLSIERKRAELKDEDVAKLVRTQIRRRKESIEQFTKGKREDLAEKEKRELFLLNLPVSLQILPPLSLFLCQLGLKCFFPALFRVE